MEEVGKEKSRRPREDDCDHGPDRWLDESSLENSGENLLASVGPSMRLDLPFIEEQHRQLCESECKC